MKKVFQDFKDEICQTYRLSGRVDGCEDEQEDEVDHDSVGEASKVEEEGHEGHQHDHKSLDERRYDVESHLIQNICFNGLT